MFLEHVPNAATYADYFWSHVHKTDGCWFWTRACSEQGYGITSILIGRKRRKVRAHRIAYLLTHGYLPDTLLVLHRCDVPMCVRPEHLDTGTHADNTEDMLAKGRHRGGCRPGEKNVRARLSGADVRVILETYRLGGMTQRALALRYGVSREAVRDIVNGKRWRHI